MRGFDLSRMKKVSSDNKSTVFLHPAGHRITVAHSALSPAMRGDLEKLPIHASEGADAGEDTRPDQTQQSSDGNDQSATAGTPININIGGAQPTQPPTGYPAPMAWPPQDQQAQPQPDQNAAPKPAEKVPRGTSQDAGAIADENSAPPPPGPNLDLKNGVARDTGAPGAIQGPGQPAVNPPMDLKSSLAAAQSAYWQDLAQGHIKPQTYGQLFASKSTLGKIGTLFGLLVSGAGSGLTHQPNVVMDMMNKELDRDFEFQKQSRGDAQNFLRMSQQQHMQDAQIENMVKTGKLTDAQAQAMRVKTDIEAKTFARSAQLMSTFHNQMQNVLKMPEGPDKQRALLMMHQLGQMVQGNLSNMNDLAESQLGVYKAMSGEGTAANREAMTVAGGVPAKMAAYETEHTIPGVEGMSTQPVTADTKAHVNNMNILDKQIARMQDFAKKHRENYQNIIANPAKYKAVQAEAQQLAAETLPLYNSAIDKLGLTHGRMEMLEKQLNEKNPIGIIQEFMGNQARLGEMRKSNQLRMNELLSGKGGAGFPQQKQSKPAGQFKEGQTGKSGKTPVVFKGGQWVPQ